MLNRLIKALPAQLMDGFDVRAFRTLHEYEVEHRVGTYLVVAGYAERVDATASEGTSPQHKDEGTR